MSSPVDAVGFGIKYHASVVKIAWAAQVASDPVSALSTCSLVDVPAYGGLYVLHHLDGFDGCQAVV